MKILQDEFDENLDDLEEKAPEPEIASKTPKEGGGGAKINLYFTSTIGPGEKKEKLLVDTANSVGAIKQTVGNIFGLNPSDFHLSHGGVTLDEASPLSNYNVTNGETILLIPASQAG
ncbi:MAG: hypothetical protein EAX96_12985 [Candidatus Lokiarchaeota archaeon]|nr:hypothetical protein [Candidatus Lokiarchaeota archaeon]